jgi:hypothetical protein
VRMRGVGFPVRGSGQRGGRRRLGVESSGRKSSTRYRASFATLGEGSIIRAEERLELGQLSVGVDDCRMKVEQGGGALGRPTPESAFGTHPEAIEHR